MPENKLPSKVVSYKKKFNDKGDQVQSQEEMMDQALEDAKKEGYGKISVQTDRPGAWTVLFYH